MLAQQKGAAYACEVKLHLEENQPNPQLTTGLKLSGYRIMDSARDQGWARSTHLQPSPCWEAAFLIESPRPLTTLLYWISAEPLNPQLLVRLDRRTTTVLVKRGTKCLMRQARQTPRNPLTKQLQPGLVSKQGNSPGSSTKRHCRVRSASRQKQSVMAAVSSLTP